MISLTAAATRVRGLDADTLTVWVQQDWVRPRREEGRPVFEEIDVARIQLIADLREDLALGDAAIPVVLSLLDQLHEARAQMRRLCEALEQGEAGSVREVLARLGG